MESRQRDPTDISQPPRRWAKFSAWYCPPDATRIPPQRKAFLDGEVSAAMRDEIVRLGMVQEGMLVSAEPGGSCDVSDFVVRNTRKMAHDELPLALRSTRH